MNFLKKAAIWFIIFLFLSSVYKDISNVQTTPFQEKESEVLHTDYHVTPIKVQTGDTVLSIVEEINKHQLNRLNIEKVLIDFQVINPKTDPYQLEIGNFYYFPIYD
ncbi:MAG: hypothetical protein ACQEWU_12625 [Bacillota bacterium]|uniref:LysM domain-containing protein n=1 Tax=Virgibacillus salarius TaxID=447199 RepID=A0A941IAU1_9BACI|nr:MULTISPECIES: hypothetical protein [Bacillaceae]NAZ09723.1 hypothetical protein [Agaribacter marinus]MBR7797013.1 hypothetical protein [Virgibacillus salarius]MCC2251016.1 hypothetical protein [Virgibacillus sp. AGTR]MDY7042748.1 hypothetical protein [Virgibacillus sp. M23]QRZ17430.1 hypothetical protein JUJ52_16910 [Virgibacillus sp. AGTR]